MRTEAELLRLRRLLQAAVKQSMEEGIFGDDLAEKYGIPLSVVSWVLQDGSNVAQATSNLVARLGYLDSNEPSSN